MKALRLWVGVYLCILVFPRPGSCGGAWVPSPGQGDVQLGASRKTASTSWNQDGDSFVNANGQGVVSYHDFRYAYLAGEVGLLPRLSTRFLMTYLDGLEGPHAELEENRGLSDAWFGLKFALREGRWPMALAGTLRTAYFYDLPGAYNRYLFDAQGRRRGLSPEWRGLLKQDYSLTYLLSHSYREGRGWINLETGYTWREGAPADQVPVSADLGYPLPYLGAALKGSLFYVRSLNNESPRQPDDRFGSGGTTDFNKASMARLGVSFLLPLGRSGKNSLEAGYNQWVWGISARRYREPFISFGRRF
jgi:hypothetical protein